MTSNINWGKVLSVWWEKLLEFLFPAILWAGDVISGFCLEGKGILKTGHGSEVKIMQGYFWFQELPLA